MEQQRVTSRRNVLRGGALAGGMVLGSGLATARAAAKETSPKAAAADAVTPAASATFVDYFLKIDGIKGESQDSTHQDWIDVASYGFRATDATKPTSAKKGKVSFKGMTFTKTVDKSSPALMTHCATGKHIPQATLTMRASNAKQDFLTITLSEVVISAYDHSAADNETPSEQISLNFGKIEMKYSTQNAN
ncbi:MAG TPA: type VI secretion system tube protein Hcp [Mycobacteriales bacterium]|nr:type VI secretion system tube protein Hcp [Mycobacteriales bacterium]